MKKTNKTKIGYFIISHGRPNEQLTYKLLCSGGVEIDDIFIVCDDLDTTLPEYIKKYGDRVIVFDKQRYMDSCDSGVQSPTGLHAVYARNAAYDLALEKGYDYFVIADDDIDSITYRYPDGDKLLSCKTKRLDDVFQCMLKFLDDTGALTVALAQGGDFIGGVDNGNFKRKLLRKAMNSFFCRTDKPYKFFGRINEDTTMYVRYGETGHLIFTTMLFMLNQGQTQKNKGGLTEMYLDSGTFVKSFYSVMYSPSCVKVAAMGDKHMRMHHQVKWECCTPKILSQKYKKGG